MIKVSATTPDGKPFYMFGLSHMNLQLLKQGKPIEFDLEEIGGTGRVCIFAGTTEETMAADIRESVAQARSTADD